MVARAAVSLGDAVDDHGENHDRQAGFKAAQEVYAEHSAKDAFFKKVFEDMRTFQRDQILWNRISELAYTQDIAGLKL